MRQLSLLIFFLLSPLCVAQAQGLLILSFTEQQTGGGKVYSTAHVDSHSSLSVVDGQKVILQKSSGREYRLQAPQNGWSLTAIEQVSTDATFIELTPRMEGEHVTVEVNYSDRRGSESVVYSSIVNGAIGQWIPLVQPAAATRNQGSKIYSSPDSGRQLLLKVEQSK